MHTIWEQRNPHWNITEQRLLDQKRVKLLDQKRVFNFTSILSDLELNELKVRLGIRGQSQDEIDQTQNRTVQDTRNLAHAENTTAATTTPNSHDPRQTPADATINDSLLEEIRTEWINTTLNAQKRNTLWIDKWKMQQIRHLTAESNHAIHVIHTKKRKVVTVKQYNRKGCLKKVIVKQYNRKGCLKSAIEGAKQRLTAISHRRQRYTARTEQYR